MTPLEIIERAQRANLVDEDGDPLAIMLALPLTESEIVDFESNLPCPLPDDIRELLRHGSEIDGILERIYVSNDLGAVFEEIFPSAAPVAEDGFGNYWLADLRPESTVFGPIYYLCHDPAVVVYQSDSFGDFLDQAIKMSTAGRDSQMFRVTDRDAMKIWTSHPGIIQFEACATSNDQVLTQFANELRPTFQICDLRSARPGDGFAWGRYGPRTVVRRHGYEPIFAYEKKSFWSRIMGG